MNLVAEIETIRCKGLLIGGDAEFYRRHLEIVEQAERCRCGAHTTPALPAKQKSAVVMWMEAQALFGGYLTAESSRLSAKLHAMESGTLDVAEDAECRARNEEMAERAIGLAQRAFEAGEASAPDDLPLFRKAAA